MLYVYTYTYLEFSAPCQLKYFPSCLEKNLSWKHKYKHIPFSRAKQSVPIKVHWRKCFFFAKNRKWKSISWARRYAPAKKNIVTKWVLPSVTEAWEKFSITSFVFSRERMKEYEKSIWQLKRNVSNAWRTRSWWQRLDTECPKSLPYWFITADRARIMGHSVHVQN